MTHHEALKETYRSQICCCRWRREAERGWFTFELHLSPLTAGRRRRGVPFAQEWTGQTACEHLNLRRSWSEEEAGKTSWNLCVCRFLKARTFQKFPKITNMSGWTGSRRRIHAISLVSSHLWTFFFRSFSAGNNKPTKLTYSMISQISPLNVKVEKYYQLNVPSPDCCSFTFTVAVISHQATSYILKYTHVLSQL